MPGERTTLASSELDLQRQEESLNRIAWVGGIGVFTLTMMALVVLSMRVRDDWWTISLYATAAGAPLLYAFLTQVVMRRMHMAAYNKYRSKLVMQLTDLHELVYRDELTGLYNRRQFYEVLQMEVEKARLSRQPLAILLMDLDGLKTINDHHGHQIGDIVLANLGKAIARHTRNVDVAARLGGDEFGVVMPGTDKRGAFSLARRLWEDLERTPMHQEGDLRMMVTISVGLAGYPWGGEEVEELIQWADADMYANKVSRKLAREQTAVPAGDAPDFTEAPDDDLYGSM
ncbi:MAG TPA: GGDEF domain-containing protein [Dehalococcoidia bacterium]|nr:GGDEF domain-containing protein [Dehalococcoidia bacterium]